MSASGLNGTLTFGIIIIFIVLGFGILFYDKIIPGFSLSSKQEKKCPTGISEDTSTSISTTTSTPTECNSDINTLKPYNKILSKNGLLNEKWAEFEEREDQINFYINKQI